MLRRLQKTLTKTQVLALLKENRNERAIGNRKKPGAKRGGLKSFGIGLTQLRKLAKQVGRDHKLAPPLWKSDVCDAKVVGPLIDDRKCEPFDVHRHLMSDALKKKLKG